MIATERDDKDDYKMTLILVCTCMPYGAGGPTTGWLGSVSLFVMVAMVI